jgi:hypothetical protein
MIFFKNTLLRFCLLFFQDIIVTVTILLAQENQTKPFEFMGEL